MIAGNPKFYEFKSYGQSSEIKLNQLLSYFNRVNSLNEIKYVFNLSKLTEIAAKKKMRNYFIRNSEAIWNVATARSFPEFAELKLKDGTFVRSKDLFKKYLEENTYTDTIFNFVISQ
ncbi:MAG: hypothetical protein U5M51_02440 [Emticicia sp.]|nr:hypothetical protein [Emticicia sp.]